MGKAIVIGIVLLAAGLGAGFGIGYYVVLQPKLNESAKQVELLQADLDKAKADLEETLKKAGKEITTAKAAASSATRDASQAKIQLNQASLKIQQLEAVLKQTMDQHTAQTSQPEVVDTPVEPAAAATAAVTPPAAPTAPGQTVEYTIAEGDSLWKIAAAQLDNGMRYKEILKLNPGITENSKLTIGMKLKLPAK